MTKDKIGILIKKRTMEIQKYFNRVLIEYNLTLPQYRILKFLYWNEEKGRAVRQVDIETDFSMTNPTVTGLIQNLEKKGFVTRTINVLDKRSKFLELTERAKNCKCELLKVGEELERRLTKNLTEEEYEQLIFLLKKIGVE